MDHRSKNTLYLGIVAVVAIILGYIVVRQSMSLEDDSGIPPALNTSKQRASPQPVKNGSKIPAPIKK